MARDLSPEALLQLSQKTSVESVVIVGIRWGGSDTELLYSDRTVNGHPNVRPVITDLSDLDSIVAVSQNETSDEVSLTLLDTSGELKDILDANDIHLKEVVIYQWFTTIPFDKKFVIFRGQINSPVVWSEGTRRLSLSAVTKLEDKEIGFSPEEGEFPGLPEDLIGKTWPECFGISVHEESLQIDRQSRGTLGEAVSMSDFTLPDKITAISEIINFLVELQVFWALAEGYLRFIGAEQAAEQVHQKQLQFVQQQAQYIQQRQQLQTEFANQALHLKSSFRVIGGEDFPRGFIELDISGAKFQGQFAGTTDIFSVSCQQHPERENFVAFSIGAPLVEGGSLCPGNTSTGVKQFPSAESFFGEQVGGDTITILTGVILGEEAGAFFAQAGAAVTISSNEPIRYITTITPGFGGVNNTGVLKVAAFSTFESGERVLVDVPTNLYTAKVINFGSVSAVVITVKDALSKQVPSWENTIHVTFQSTVGPNTVDIMKYLIGKYSGLTYDTASFNKVRGFLANYPMNFCYKTKKNLITALKELAFMSMCAIFIRNGVFHLKYLPETPTVVHTFKESNVKVASLALGFTETEDLMTKFIGTWRSHGAQPEDNKIILKQNVKKYGTHEKQFDFYAYSNIDIVLKSMNFWLARRSHTWKKLTFQASMDSLNVEVFDGVSIDFIGNYASNVAFTGLVENARYDSLTHTVDFEIWTGVRAGDMAPSDLAFSKDVSKLVLFPSEIDVASGFAGGDSIGKDAEGVIVREGGTGLTVQYNGAVDPFGWDDARTSDHTPRKISDVGDLNPGEPEVKETGAIIPGLIPLSNPIDEPRQIPDPEFPFTIDIRETEVVDSENGTSATLDSFFKAIKDSKLQGSVNAEWSDGSKDAEFDFKHDSEGNKFGAGTAFLKDD